MRYFLILVLLFFPLLSFAGNVAPFETARPDDPSALQVFKDYGSTGRMDQAYWTALYRDKAGKDSYVKLKKLYECPAGYSWASDALSCQPRPPSKCKGVPGAPVTAYGGANVLITIPFSKGQSNVPNHVCDKDNCSVSQTSGGGGANAAGTSYGMYGKWEMSGSCDGSADQPVASSTDQQQSNDKSKDPVACASKGGSFGQVNGVDTCVPNNPSGNGTSTKTDTKSQETKSNDGTSIKTDTKTTVTCSDGSCTTTTTTTTQQYDASGNPTGPASTSITSTKNPDQGGGAGNGGAPAKGDGTGKGSGSGSSQTPDSKGFCETNPNSPLCVSGKWSGDCKGGAPACEGDPVQCAQAVASFNTYCAIAGQGDGSSLAEKIIAGQDPDADKMPGNKVANYDFSDSIKSDSWLSSSCPADRQINVLGQTITVAFSSICDYLVFMGRVGVAASLVVAAFILFR